MPSAENTLAAEEKALREEHWKPFPGGQQIALDSPAREIFFGSGRGPGKTEVQLYWLAKMAVAEDPKASNPTLLYPDYKGAQFRLKSTDLRDWHGRATKLFCGKLGAKTSGQPTEYKFPGGPVIRSGHLQNGGYINYIGWEIHKMGIDEAPHIPTVRNRNNGLPECPDYQMLLASLRLSPDGNAQAFLTGNPGPHPGVPWVKHRFIDVYYADGTKVPPRTMFKDPVSGKTRIFVNASILENLFLMEFDPGYLNSLKELPPLLQKAWIWGDWDSYEGQFFDFNREVHVVEPQAARHLIPPHVFRWLSMDWGFNHPGAVYAHAQGLDGRVHTYDEMYFDNKPGAKTGSYEAGVRIAERYIKDLVGLPDNTMTLYVSHDMFAADDEGDRRVDSLQKGIRQILGQSSTFIVEMNEEEKKEFLHDPEAAVRMMNYRRSQMMNGYSIVIAAATKNSISGYDYVREMLRYNFTPVTTEPEQKVIERLRLLPAGEHLIMNYLSGFSNVQEILPKNVIWSCCEELIKTIPDMVSDPDRPEFMLKQDGDDAVDAWVYGIVAHRNHQNDVPLSYFVHQRIQAGAMVNGKIDLSMAHQAHMQALAEYEKLHGTNLPTRLGRMGQRHGLLR